MDNILKEKKDKRFVLEMNVQKLKDLKNIDICTVSKTSLVDIREIKIDRKMSQKERMAEYIRQVKNPYCVCCDGVIVKMRFDSEEETLEDKLTNYFLSKQSVQK